MIDVFDLKGKEDVKKSKAPVSAGETCRFPQLG